MPLRFYLRLDSALLVPYESVCRESCIREFAGKQIQISFSSGPAGTIDNADWTEKPMAVVSIRIDADSEPSEETVNLFAIRNCEEILNWLITCYQAATGEVSNAGFVGSIGTSDIQLFADIRLNGRDIRARWPSHSFNTLPLQDTEIKAFESYLCRQEDLPLARLLYINAMTSLEQGRYWQTVLQAAAAVEVRITDAVCKRLKSAAWSDAAIKPFQDSTLGTKLAIPPTDPRSIETYFPGASKRPKDKLVPLRNRVAHRGYLPSEDEGREAVAIAVEFLNLVV